MLLVMGCKNRQDIKQIGEFDMRDSQEVFLFEKKSGRVWMLDGSPRLHFKEIPVDNIGEEDTSAPLKSTSAKRAPDGGLDFSDLTSTK